METKERVTKSPSTPCGRPLHSDYRGNVLENIICDVYEIIEISDETKGETTRPVQKTCHLLPKNEKISDKDGARNKELKVGRDTSRARNLFGSAKKLWNNLISSAKDYETEVLNLENELEKQVHELRESATRIDDLTKSLHAKDEELQNLKVTLNKFRQENLNIRDAGQKEVQKLQSYIEQRERASKDAELCANQLKAKCQKLESKLALIEQKTAQESLTSGSYSDDHANPGMLEVACKSVDKAIDDLARVLYNISTLKTLPLDSVELEQLLHLISPAQPADFSRPIQVRNVWGHWICWQVFQYFEHVFFDSDQQNRTSPLDSKKHALECFQSFQQKNGVSSLELLNGCGNFHFFFFWKYNCVFPAWLVDSGILPSGIIVNEYGHFVEGEIFHRFMDVAKAVWLLHELAFSFDPPASILRMARGEPYDKQFHDSVVHDVEDGVAPSAKVAFMIRPAFRVRQSIVRSRVLLSTKLPQ